MKHFFKIFLIVMLVGLVGCSLVENKVKLSLSEFKEKMESNDFIVMNASALFPTQEHVEGIYIAQKDEYQIEFFDLNSSENATKMFNSNKSIFDQDKSEFSTSSSINLGNFSSYTLKTGGKFKYISKIDDTMIYLNVDEVYEEEVKLILEGLGY